MVQKELSALLQNVSALKSRIRIKKNAPTVPYSVPS